MVRAPGAIGVGRLRRDPIDHRKRECVHGAEPDVRVGDVHGVAPYFYQTAGHRPTPDLSQYTVPGVERFYLTGGEPFLRPDIEPGAPVELDVRGQMLPGQVVKGPFVKR